MSDMSLNRLVEFVKDHYGKSVGLYGSPCFAELR